MIDNDVIGHQYNCAICLAFIEFVPKGKQQSQKGCPNGCKISCNAPKMSGYITNVKE